MTPLLGQATQRSTSSRRGPGSSGEGAWVALHMALSVCLPAPPRLSQALSIQAPAEGQPRSVPSSPLTGPWSPSRQVASLPGPQQEAGSRRERPRGLPSGLALSTALAPAAGFVGGRMPGRQEARTKLGGESSRSKGSWGPSAPDPSREAAPELAPPGPRPAQRRGEDTGLAHPSD